MPRDNKGSVTRPPKRVVPIPDVPRPDDSDETPPVKSGMLRLGKTILAEAAPSGRRTWIKAGVLIRGLFFNFDGWVFETQLGPLSVWTSCVVYEKPETQEVA
jgi:hypothetical protein